MKKLSILTLLLILPMLAWGTKFEDHTKRTPQPGPIPVQFTTSSETSILVWGCPVSDLVAAGSQAEAIDRIGQECMVEAKRAAVQKPGVFEVIQVSVIWPESISLYKRGG